MVIEIKNVAWHAKIKSAWHNGAYTSLEVCVCDPVRSNPDLVDTTTYLPKC